jgi:hypothetical protein
LNQVFAIAAFGYARALVERILMHKSKFSYCR